MQKKLGVVDSVESYMADAGKSATNKDLLRLQAENSGPTIDWLVGLGVEFKGPFEYPEQHSVPRLHMLYPNSGAWPKVLGPLMEKRGIVVLLGTPGRKLYTDTKGAVIGVMAQDTGSGKYINILAKRAVVMGGGDGLGSKQWRQKFTQDATLLAVRATQPYNDGSNFYMAMAIGADLVDLQTAVSPSFRDHSHVLLGNGPSQGPNDIGPGGTQAWMPYNMYQAGAIIVNTDGKRYVNEQGSTLATTVENQPGKVSFIVFDQPVADIFNKWPMVVSSLPGVGEKSGWGWCSVDDLVYRGNIQVANTIDEVVAKVAGVTKLQISASGLKDTIAKWNGYAAAGKDPEFGRTTFGMEALKGAGIKGPPYYIEGPCASELQSQRISLVVDTKLRVYDLWGKVIPRLYACGNIGSNRGGVVSGHGGQMSWTFTSGRLVGKNAAAEAPLT